ncbi:hypothetical protein N7454_008174 [Penicillium verhagenii]|nr:hypothetical protein N7454_008174 [Penicillium verhagenii]
MTIQNQSPAVRIVEVGPRDGLQNIQDQVPTSTKLELIQRLQECEMKTIELTSVVSPKAVPQLSDCRSILGNERVQEEMKNPSLRFPVLVPNMKGLEIAIQYGVKEIAVFISATEGFSKANINCSVEEGLARAKKVTSLALKSNIAVRGYVSCIFQDPYHGPTSPSSVLHCVKTLLDAGCYEVSIADTLGVGSQSDVRSLITHLTKNNIPLSKLAGHFHNTYGQASANVWEAYKAGIRVFDSSVGGLGGCPFAPGAAGNVASEDLVHMFHNAGVNTGVNLAKLEQTGEWILQQLGKSQPSAANLAKKSGEVKNVASKSGCPRTVGSKTDRTELSGSGLSFKVTFNSSESF